jgi:hypothetical protein
MHSPTGSAGRSPAVAPEDATGSPISAQTVPADLVTTRRISTTSTRGPVPARRCSPGPMGRAASGRGFLPGRRCPAASCTIKQPDAAARPSTPGAAGPSTVSSRNRQEASSPDVYPTPSSPHGRRPDDEFGANCEYPDQEHPSVRRRRGMRRPRRGKPEIAQSCSRRSRPGSAEVHRRSRECRSFACRS